MKSITAIMTGTKLGYEDYHGEFYDEKNNFISEWYYDQRQHKYICGIMRLTGTKKRFYGNSIKSLKYQIEQYLLNNLK